ncbi:anti-sigma regulatory factor [Acidimicrobiia bacterium EGI L10123]|uniref:ATP-binding protein n=1 Tax=Salinilacustrithrix flava TaxID=2957203 RepID=UPI003D7C146A|nr:anti-sigma regulatory factor [Acidimicrobiia bacterium EGI L10123]
MEGVTSRDTIRMTIPALLAYVRLPRVAIAGLATRSGFSYDEVEDLRLAVGEVCQVLLDGADRNGTLTIEFTVARGTLGVEVAIDAPPGRHDGLAERLAEQILDATVGKVEIDDDGRRISFSMRAADDDE